jgi:mannose-1-phosphate guanylyltransferase
MIPARRKVSLEREIFPVLAKRGQLIGFPLNGTWFDIGNLSDYRRANFALLRTMRRRSGFPRKSKKNGKLKQPLFLGIGSKVLADARVGPNVVMGSGCLIERGARVTNTILFDEVKVGERSSISGAIIASKVRIEKSVKIDPGVIISPNVMVDKGVKIGRNAVIHSHKEITMNVAPSVHVL